MSNKVIRSIAKNFARTRERISDVMGGKILEYEAKTILNQGREEGVQECVYISNKLTILHGQSDHLSRRFRSLISKMYSR